MPRPGSAPDSRRTIVDDLRLRLREAVGEEHAIPSDEIVNGVISLLDHFGVVDRRAQQLQRELLRMEAGGA